MRKVRCILSERGGFKLGCAIVDYEPAQSTFTACILVDVVQSVDCYAIVESTVVDFAEHVVLQLRDKKLVCEDP